MTEICHKVEIAKSVNYKGKGYLRCISCANNTFIPYLDACVQSCPQGFQPRNNFCVCANYSLILVDDICRDLPTCPKGTYFDYNLTFSCL